MDGTRIATPYQIQLITQFGRRGTENAGELCSPSGITLGEDNEIIVADTRNNRLQVFDYQGRFRREISGLDDLYSHYPIQPVKVAFNFTYGMIFFAEKDSCRRVMGLNSSKQLNQSFGQILQPSFYSALCLSVDYEGNVLFLERSRGIVFLQILIQGMPPSNHISLNNVKKPNSITGKDKILYICDWTQKHLLKFNYSGSPCGYFGKEGYTEFPIAVFIEEASELLVLVNYKGGLQVNKFASDGTHYEFYKSTLQFSSQPQISFLNDVMVSLSDHKICVFKLRKVCNRGASVMPRSQTSGTRFQLRQLTRTCAFNLKLPPDTRYSNPMGVAAFMNDGLCLANTQNGGIQAFDGKGNFLSNFYKPSPDCSFRLLDARKMKFNYNYSNLFVLEINPTSHIVIFNRYGKFVRKFGEGVLSRPISLTIDKLDQIFVVEEKKEHIKLFTRPYVEATEIKCERLSMPVDIDVDSKECLYIADQSDQCIKVYSYFGVLLRYIGGNGVIRFPKCIALFSEQSILIGTQNSTSIGVALYTTQGNFLAAAPRMSPRRINGIAVMLSGKVAVLTDDGLHPVYLFSVPSID